MIKTFWHILGSIAVAATLLFISLISIQFMPELENQVGGFALCSVILMFICIYPTFHFDNKDYFHLAVPVVVVGMLILWHSFLPQFAIPIGWIPKTVFIFWILLSNYLAYYVAKKEGIFFGFCIMVTFIVMFVVMYEEFNGYEILVL